MGGVSDGFALEGFDVTGIDIVDAPKMLGYKHCFIQADMLTLKGEDFRGFDVVWGSPPCRDFCLFAKRFGKTWKKNPPSPESGMLLVKAFQRFLGDAKPMFWIMENVPELQNYFKPAKIVANLRGERQMVRAFWGDFPAFLIPRDNKNIVMRYRPECNRKEQVIMKREERARIPLACSRAFAKACKEALDDQVMGKTPTFFEEWDKAIKGMRFRKTEIPDEVRV
jgi:site-specific DNA-cytosine methylase